MPEEVIKAIATLKKWCEKCGDDCDGCEFRKTYIPDMPFCVLTAKIPCAWDIPDPPKPAPVCGATGLACCYCQPVCGSRREEKKVGVI